MSRRAASERLVKELAENDNPLLASCGTARVKIFRAVAKVYNVPKLDALLEPVCGSGRRRGAARTAALRVAAASRGSEGCADERHRAGE